MESSFDYVIVGGGTAGCVLANRLSADGSKTVLLIESGNTDSNPYIHIPATLFKIMEKGRDVHVYQSEPDKGLNGRPTLVPQGKVMGGGSSVNGMIYIRGQRLDYNGWAQMGCRNWSYEKVLPVFRSLENNERLSGEYHGAEGPVMVTDRSYGHPLSWAFVRAAQEAGLPYSEDFNGASQEGVGFYQATKSRTRRWSTARAFLREAMSRPNLIVLTNRRAHKIEFAGTRATGVRLVDGAVFHAREEIVLTAGALATPKILQLSGVGDAAHLQGHGIPVVAHLPGVGENYQDHIQTTVQGELKDPSSLLGEDKRLRGVRHMLEYLLFGRGLLTSNLAEAGGFADTAGTGEPDVQFHVFASMLGFAERAAPPGHGVTIDPCFLRPRSRGTVKLRSANPDDSALFVANSLSDPEDLETLVRGMHLAIRILEAPSLARLIKRRVLPEPGVEKDPAALRDFIRSYSHTAFHPSGTAKMGPSTDLMAVTTEDLKVHRVQRLRVADASIMPTLVSGNTNAPTMMIAERAARFITGKEHVA